MDVVRECLCGNPFNPDKFMIQCDMCKTWFHGECVAVKEYMSIDIDKFHCPLCKEKYGPSIMKIRLNNHRHDYSEKDADIKPVQTGTPVFIKELKSRHFSTADDIIKYLSGNQLTIQYLQTFGFQFPIVINNKEGLEMVVPSSDISLHEIENYIGGDREMDVIDVVKQNNIRMKLSEFVEYYNDLNRSKVFNVISLEFTNTRLSPLVEAPYVARKLDWVNCIWPKDWPYNCEIRKPEVQKYCLIGVKDSFTDFHIDFGGTSVWYHVLRGEKIFYLIQPTLANLHLYQQWMCSSTQNETFFGDQVDVCYKCVLKQGQTMLIPTGWIHAVLTPVDSLVFGGNFVHSLNIPMQIQIYEMEKKMKTPEKFLYPCFETIHWFAAKRLLRELKDLNSEEKQCPDYLLQGIKALLSILKQWNTDKDYNMTSRSQIPVAINTQKLLKDLSKEIRLTDKHLLAVNPPKPERESKRNKKKAYTHDFLNCKPSNKGDIKTNIQPVDTNHLAICDSHEKNNSINFKKLKAVNFQDEVYNKFKKSSDFKNSNTLKSNLKKPSSQKIDNKMKKILCPGKQSPTLIRFKLGDKEIIRTTKVYNKNANENSGLENEVSAHKELSWKQTSSVYDFHDGSNESSYNELIIDDTTKKRKRSQNSQSKRTCISETKDLDSQPTNGIEELLKASAFATNVETKSDARASPSTRDAIAGMLSFSAQCYSTDVKSTPEYLKKKKNFKYKNKKQNFYVDDDLLIENIDKIYQDDDFIYPALDASDDDEFLIKLKGKKSEDEAWNPKAKVGPLLPKTNRPARESAKKTFVTKNFKETTTKKPDATKKIKRKKQNDQLTTPKLRECLTTTSEIISRHNTPSEIVESSIYPNNLKCLHLCSSAITNSSRLKDVKAKLSAPVPGDRKPKKGLKTAKQRLGKILKIHRMLH